MTAGSVLAASNTSSGTKYSGGRRDLGVISSGGNCCGSCAVSFLRFLEVSCDSAPLGKRRLLYTNFPTAWKRLREMGRNSRTSPPVEEPETAFCNRRVAKDLSREPPAVNCRALIPWRKSPPHSAAMAPVSTIPATPSVFATPVSARWANVRAMASKLTVVMHCGGVFLKISVTTRWSSLSSLKQKTARCTASPLRRSQKRLRKS
mmetsp:Transcript_58893/g.156796  ORF Transcript_58893/g.156796 Transcript_58893/m.156796 type:complete len:205 (-) Transcript_58893:172-786(-)